MMMEARKITAEEHARSVNACAYSVRGAARILGVGEAVIRREAKRLGVRKIDGPVVAGLLLFSGPGGTVALPYSE
jgi:hypothetical protein